MVAQDHGLAAAEYGGDPLALLDVEYDAGKVVENVVVLEESASILSDRVEAPAQRRPGPAVYRVAVSGGDNIRPGRVDLGMDRERGRVHPAVTAHHLAAGIHQYQVRHSQVGVMHAERVHPEPLGEFGIPRRHVPGYPVVEVVAGENT